MTTPKTRSIGVLVALSVLVVGLAGPGAALVPVQPGPSGVDASVGVGELPLDVVADDVSAADGLATRGPVTGTAAVAHAGGAANTTNDTDEAIPPGQHLAGVVGVQRSEIRGSVDERAFDIRIANAGTEDDRADVVADEVTDIEARLSEVRTERQRLDAARENGTVSRGEYAARMATLGAELRTAQRLASRTERHAEALPAQAREQREVNRTRIGALRQQARDLAGPSVAASTRTIAGPDFAPGRDRRPDNATGPSRPNRPTNEPGGAPGNRSDQGGPPETVTGPRDSPGNDTGAGSPPGNDTGPGENPGNDTGPDEDAGNDPGPGDPPGDGADRGDSANNETGSGPPADDSGRSENRTDHGEPADGDTDGSNDDTGTDRNGPPDDAGPDSGETASTPEDGDDTADDPRETGDGTGDGSDAQDDDDDPERSGNDSSGDGSGDDRPGAGGPD